MITIVKDKKHKGMFRLRWGNGDTSVSHGKPFPDEKGVYGFYNRTRASELARLLEERENEEIPTERNKTYRLIPSTL